MNEFPRGWHIAKLGELVDNFDAQRRPIKSIDRVPGPNPYYGASGIIDSVDGYTHDGEFLLVAEDGENLRTRATPMAFMASGKIWVNNHAHVLAGKSGVITRFLCYRLSATDISGYLTGTTQPKLSRSAVDSIPILIPPISVQMGVVEVLKALDDKIAANRKLAQTADELAVQTLRECDVAPLIDLVEHRRSSQMPLECGVDRVAHFSLPAFDEGESPEVVDPMEIKSSKFRVEAPSVLISKLNPRFPRIWEIPAVPEIPAYSSTEFLVLEPKYGSTSTLWAALRQPAVTRQLESMVAGTSGSHQRVKPADLLSVDVPDVRSINDRTRSTIDGLSAVIHAARRESQNMATLRNALLPRLMAGELRVRDAEEFVEVVLGQ